MKIRCLKGFTLIEIIISLAVLLIGVLAILSLFPVGFDAAMRSADLTKAGIYGQWKMEDIKKAGFPIAGSSGACSDPRFTYTVTALNDPPGATDTYQRITVGISWTYRGKNYNEDFVTYIPKYAP